MNIYKLKQYKTHEEIECAYHQNEITIEDLESGAISLMAMDIDGNEIELTWAEKNEDTNLCNIGVLLLLIMLFIFG